MKNIMNFLKRHTAAVLLLVVVLTASVGTLWAKYTTSVAVTSNLKLTVAQTAPAEYVIDKTVFHNKMAALKDAGYDPTVLKFVNNGSELGTANLTFLGNAACSNDTNLSIGLYWSASDTTFTTLYLAPYANGKAGDGVIYAPVDSSYLFDSSKTKFTNLTTIELSNLNTSKVTNMAWMFANNGKLTSIVGLSSFNTSSVINMMDMFGSCISLTELDLSNLDTKSVTNMQGMFYNCTGLKLLTLSSKFNTSIVTNMVWMFYGDGNLTTIKVGTGFTTESVSNSELMFYGCSRLVGGKGTTIKDGYLDKTYACIDGGDENPGYFTDANAVANDIPIEEAQVLDDAGASALSAPAEASPAVTETPAGESAPAEESVDGGQAGSDDSDSTETPAGESAAAEDKANGGQTDSDSDGSTETLAVTAAPAPAEPPAAETSPSAEAASTDGTGVN